MNKKKKSDQTALVIIGMVAAAVMFIVLMSAIVSKLAKSGRSSSEVSVEEVIRHTDVTDATPVKGTVNLDSSNLYDELPDISKYPLKVTGRGDIVIEIATSGEKAGDGTDRWLIDVAENFNKEGFTTGSGRSIGMSVRSVPSGTAADYIMSGKYVPDIYTPSNTLFGEYAKVNGADLEVGKERLVGNTAGILVKKGSSYTDFDSVITAVQANEIQMGYTNPQTSATGMNLLLTLLEDGEESFTSFNKNIPYVAYTTQQMRDSAANGTLDGMLTEYQAYINDDNLKNAYTFIPFGVRHDNPAYICNKGSKSADELEAINIILDYSVSESQQKIATRYGFNANDEYTSDLQFTGADVTSALKTYKKAKDNGKDIIAVFVADCSGSMDGDPMLQLKESLSNGANYINDNNYIGLVSYSTDVTRELPIAQFDLNQRSYFQGAIDNFYANGGTSTYEALSVAIDMVKKEKENHTDAKCMIFLLSDGYANGRYDYKDLESAIDSEDIPVYTIAYGSGANTDELKNLSNINEGAAINADSDDIVYKIKSLFNSQL